MDRPLPLPPSCLLLLNPIAQQIRPGRKIPIKDNTNPTIPTVLDCCGTGAAVASAVAAASEQSVPPPRDVFAARKLFGMREVNMRNEPFYDLNFEPERINTERDQRE